VPQYFATVLVLHSCREGEDPHAVELAGYYRGFGLTASHLAEARELLQAEVPDGIIDWAETTIDQTSFDQLDDDVRASCSDPGPRGVWYGSGRLYFPAD
jgi:hypothetical protein